MLGHYTTRPKRVRCVDDPDSYQLFRGPRTQTADDAVYRVLRTRQPMPVGRFLQPPSADRSPTSCSGCSRGTEGIKHIMKTPYLAPMGSRATNCGRPLCLGFAVRSGLDGTPSQIRTENLRLLRATPLPIGLTEQGADCTRSGSPRVRVEMDEIRDGHCRYATLVIKSRSGGSDPTSAFS